MLWLACEVQYLRLVIIRLATDILRFRFGCCQRKQQRDVTPVLARGAVSLGYPLKRVALQLMVDS